MSNVLHLVKPRARLQVRKFGTVWCVWWSGASNPARRWFKKWENAHRYWLDEIRIARASNLDNVIPFPAKQMSFFHAN